MVDPEAGEMEQLIPANEDLRPIQVTISHDGELLLIVMSDGEVRMYEAHDLDLLAASSDILGAEIDPGFWARPHIATAPGRIFITDSAAGEVIALESHDLGEAGRWEVAGKPTKIAFVGLLAPGDHPEEGHDHEERARPQRRRPALLAEPQDGSPLREPNHQRVGCSGPGQRRGVPG